MTPYTGVLPCPRSVRFQKGKVSDRRHRNNQAGRAERAAARPPGGLPSTTTHCLAAGFCGPRLFGGSSMHIALFKNRSRV